MARFAPRQMATVASAVSVNAGDLRSWRRASFKSAIIVLLSQCAQSLVTQRLHGIDMGGAARGNKTGNCGNNCQKTGDREINERIEWVNFEENVSQNSRYQDSEQQSGGAGAEHKSNGQLPCALRHDHSENSSRVRSKGHSNPKFLRALAPRKTHHAVKTHRRENECEATENREQTNDDAISGKTFIVQSSSCTRKIDRYIRIKLGYGLIQSWTERFRVLASARSNEDRAKLSGRRCAKEWHIEAGIVRLLIQGTLHQCVGN